MNTYDFTLGGISHASMGDFTNYFSHYDCRFCIPLLLW